ncbi:vacuolar protein sorting-associated protein 33B, partial [Geospiza fortis]|uniref:Vacuolar protein sorting-associated protein 33B n=1 Tax=Geospiza fortis TaxID=48883 RepID=A0A8N5EW20_GEOFO
MEMKRFQKINHFPGMIELCRKDLLARNLNRMLRLFPKEYNIFPRTWCLPADYGDFHAYRSMRKARTFICKPDNSCQGRGIFITHHPEEIKHGERMICQQYISEPFLIDGFKFDMRIYVLVTSCDPLKIFLYKEGLARFATMRYIADIVNADKMSGRSRKYKIIFSPQKFYACEMVLEEEGVFGDVTCDEWSFYLLPLDEDIISMELPEFFRDYFLEGDHRWINPVARALQLLNSLYGPFGKTHGIGRCAKMSYELWRDLEEESEGEGQGRKPEIGHVFLMDRDTDYVTALCSQVVYEGLVDDTFRIKCGSVDFGPDVTSSDKSIKVLLNSQDKVFSQIRNEHFSNVFGFLSQKSRNLQAQYDRRRGMDIKQMKDFVSQELKGLKQEHRLLSLHIGACESIMKKKTKQDFQETIKAEHSLLEGFDIRESTSFIEEHIDRQVSPVESLRLMCLLSITENGLIPKDYRSLKTQYLQSYGPEHLLTFHNLKRIGLLTEQAAGETLTAVESKVSKLVTDRAAGKITDAFSSLARKSNFRAISKKLGLIPRLDGEYDLKMPRDMAYVFGGAYVPLSCKIIEQVLERRG